MTLEEVFDIARRKRFLVVSSVAESGAPESALMGFALTQANEIVFDTMGTSRKAVNLARNPKAALVIGWDDQVSLQIEGVARRPAGDDLASAKAAYFREWPDGRARESWPRHRLCRRAAEMDPIFQLRRRSSGRRGVQALTANRRERLSRPVAPTAFGVYTSPPMLTPIRVGE